MIRRLALALVLICAAGAAQATCTLPYTILNGTLTDAPQVMANFQALLNCIVGGGTVTSITANTPIVVTPSPITGVGVVSHATTAVTPGSYTNTNLTVDSTGHITNASNGSTSGITGLANPTATIGVAAVNGSATTAMRSDAAPAIPQATTSVFGAVKPDGTTITATAGVISAVTPTGSCAVSGAAGIVSNNGSNACVTDTDALLSAGALSLGTSGTVGSVAMGNNTSGTVTLSPVSGAALGTVTALFPANSGIVAELNLPQSWTAAQRGTPVNVAISTATFTPNFDTGQNFEIDLTSACPCTLANPSTTLVAGQSGVIEIHQDGSGSRTIDTWGSEYQYSGGTSTITLSTAASAIDYLSYYVNAAGTGIVLGAIVASPSH